MPGEDWCAIACAHAYACLVYIVMYGILHALPVLKIVTYAVIECISKAFDYKKYSLMYHNSIIVFI